MAELVADINPLNLAAIQFSDIFLCVLDLDLQLQLGNNHDRKMTMILSLLL